MSEVFRVINEFEARKVNVMYFNTNEFKIYKDEIEEFRAEGYNVTYLGYDNLNGKGFIENYSISKLQ